MIMVLIRMNAPSDSLPATWEDPVGKIVIPGDRVAAVDCEAEKTIPLPRF
jgi:hypothetical protein